MLTAYTNGMKPPPKSYFDELFRKYMAWIILAAILFMKRMSDETNVHGWKYVENENDDTSSLQPVPKSVRIYEISGPLFFGVAGRIADISVKDYTKCLVIRMRSVPAIDATAMNALVELHNKCSKKGISIVFSHVNEQPMNAMKKAGFADVVGKDKQRMFYITSLLDMLQEQCGLAHASCPQNTN